MSKTVIFAFGRMNPPTNGHGKLIAKVKRMAQQQRADHLIVASHSFDKLKNPLEPSKKLKHLQAMFPGTNFATSDKTNPNFIKQLGLLTGKYDNVIMIAGSDRVQDFQRLLDTYNGKDFTFKSAKVVSAGERDPDAEGVAGISASKMRLYAKNNEFSNFKRGLPTGYRGAKQLFKDVRAGMELKETYKSFSQFLRD
jgi:nicotinic acid mononucleotide adenylyltransferase